jgi:hypothetical protein
VLWAGEAEAEEAVLGVEGGEMGVSGDCSVVVVVVAIKFPSASVIFPCSRCLIISSISSGKGGGFRPTLAAVSFTKVRSSSFFLPHVARRF